MLKHYGSAWGGYMLETELISLNSVILSVGLGNDISFDLAVMQEWPGLAVVGVDPTQSAANTVRNSIQSSNYLYVRKALWDTSGETISLGGPAMSALVESGETAQTISLADLIQEAKTAFPGRPIAVLKMDIEGSEYRVLEACQDLDITQLAIEWHHWLNRDGDMYKSRVYNNPYILEDTKRAMRVLLNKGYGWLYRSEEHCDRVLENVLLAKKNLLSNATAYLERDTTELIKGGIKVEDTE
jgi:FkbM family methyltransferase